MVVLPADAGRDKTGGFNHEQADIPFVLLIYLLLAAAVRADTLPSWHDGPAKTAIQAFVTAVTRESGPDFVPPSERIAVFDNDGTLWPEQPMYVQLAFALDRLKTLDPQRPECRD